jgi:hypothetical protein
VSEFWKFEVANGGMPQASNATSLLIGPRLGVLTSTQFILNGPGRLISKYTPELLHRNGIDLRKPQLVQHHAGMWRCPNRVEKSS